MEANVLEGIVKGGYGQTITMTVKDPDTITAVDLSSYDGDKEGYFRSPDSIKTVTVTLSFGSDGTDGQITFSFADGDIDREGTWTGTLEFNKSGEVLVSYPITMKVKKRVGV